MADEPNTRTNDEPEPESNEPVEHPAESSSAIVDEYGEPLADEHEHVRKRPLYRRPVFLIVVAIVLGLALLFGLRYWAYARAHESTDDAFIDGHIIQVSPKVSGYVL